MIWRREIITCRKGKPQWSSDFFIFAVQQRYWCSTQFAKSKRMNGWPCVIVSIYWLLCFVEHHIYCFLRTFRTHTLIEQSLCRVILKSRRGNWNSYAIFHWYSAATRKVRIAISSITASIIASIIECCTQWPASLSCKLEYVRHGPLVRYVKSRVVHAVGMPGTFSPQPPISDPDMHHDTWVTYVPWYKPGLLTNGFLWRWQRENVPCIPGACATRNFTCLVRGPL